MLRDSVDMTNTSPSPFSFNAKLKVRVDDINYGGHLANEKILLFFHEARIQYLKVLGVSELDIGDGISLTQAEAFVSYKSEAFLGDELHVNLRIDDFSRTRFKVHYLISREGDEKLVAAGYVVLAAFDYKAKRLQRIPQSFKENVEKYQMGSVKNQ